MTPITVVGIDIGNDNTAVAAIQVIPSHIPLCEGVTLVTGSATTLKSPPGGASAKTEYISAMTARAIGRLHADVVVIEKPFFNSLFPLAAIRLYRLYYAIIQEITNLYPAIEIRSITAPKARSLIGYKRVIGVATKDNVKAALHQHQIVTNLFSNFTDLDEHSIDAVVVAIAYIIHKLDCKLEAPK